jgi:hypothetical protein
MSVGSIPKRKASRKNAYLPELRGNTNVYWNFEGAVHDVNVLDEIVPEP